MVRHPARGLNLGDHTNQAAHDAPWFGVRGSNAGPEMVTPGGAPLYQCCCRSRNLVSIYPIHTRAKWLYIYSLNDKAVKDYQQQKTLRVCQPDTLDVPFVVLIVCLCDSNNNLLRLGSCSLDWARICMRLGYRDAIQQQQMATS